MTLRSETHRGRLRLQVGPAGSHGAHNASAGIHVQVPPGQDHLSPTSSLSHEPVGVGLKPTAERFTEVHPGNNRALNEGEERMEQEVILLLCTWTWSRPDSGGWSWRGSPGSAGCHTRNELRHSGRRRGAGPDGTPPPPPAAAASSSTAAPTPPAERRRWPGEGPPHSPPAGQSNNSKIQKLCNY